MNKPESLKTLYPKGGRRSLHQSARPSFLVCTGLVMMTLPIPLAFILLFGRSFQGYSNGSIMAYILLFSVLNAALEATLLVMGPIRANVGMGIVVRALRALASTALILSCIAELNTIGEISSMARGLGTPVAVVILLGPAITRIGQKNPF